jgi:hypothetical protein
MPSLIHEKMAAIMAEIGAVAKGRRNQAQGYNFRGIDEVYAELHPAMSTHGVFMTSEILAERSEERQTKSGGASIYRILTIRFTFWTTDGSHIETTVIGEGMDSGDKASNKAMSVAQKYALLQAFLIPTEEAKDPENDSHDVKAKPVQTQVSQPAAKPATEPPKDAGQAQKLLVELGGLMGKLPEADAAILKAEVKEVGKGNAEGLAKLLATWTTTIEARNKPKQEAVPMSAADMAGASKAFDAAFEEVGLF